MRNRSFTILIAVVAMWLAPLSPVRGEINNTNPSPVCIGSAFEVQGTFGRRPNSYQLALYPKTTSLAAALGTQPLVRWPQSDISWTSSKLAVKARAWTGVGAGTYKLVLIGRARPEELESFHAKNCASANSMINKDLKMPRSAIDQPPIRKPVISDSVKRKVQAEIAPKLRYGNYFRATSDAVEAGKTFWVWLEVANIGESHSGQIRLARKAYLEDYEDGSAGDLPGAAPGNGPPGAVFGPDSRDIPPTGDRFKLRIALRASTGDFGNLKKAASGYELTDRIWLVHADTGLRWKGMGAQKVTLNLPDVRFPQKPRYDLAVHFGQLRVFDPSCGGLADRKKYWVLTFDGWPQHSEYSSVRWDKKVKKGQYNINKTLYLKNIREDREIRINTYLGHIETDSDYRGDLIKSETFSPSEWQAGGEHWVKGKLGGKCEWDLKYSFGAPTIAH